MMASLRHARRHDSTWQGPPWESVPCVVGHGRIIRLRVRTSVGPGRPSERRGRVAGRELAARPAVDPGGGRAAVPCVPVPEVSQTWRSSSTASRPGSLQIPGASVLAQNGRGASGRSSSRWDQTPRSQVTMMARSDPLPRTPHGQGNGSRQRFGVNPRGSEELGMIAPFWPGACATRLQHAALFVSWLQGPGANLQWRYGNEAVEDVLHEE